MSYGKLSSNGISFAPTSDESSLSKLERYRAFVKRKAEISRSFGLDVDLSEIHPVLHNTRGNDGKLSHQPPCVQWMCRGGRRALFLAFGLGKTVIQEEGIRLILKKAKIGKPGLIVAPLGVRQEFRRDAKMIGQKIRFIRSNSEIEDPDGLYLTNYETVREGKLDPTMFAAASLDEAAILRGFGGVKTFREFMVAFEPAPYRFVATATPDPNEYIELLAYAAFLGIMDVSQAKTRFFKRDSTKADKLTIHPHKEQEFWLWCSTWALFLNKPSDLGPEYSDASYEIPEFEIIHHEIRAGDRVTTADRGGQYRLIQDASLGVVDAAKEKRASLDERITEVQKIMAASPKDHFLLWHDLKDERAALEELPFVSSVYGKQDLDEREQIIIDFAAGKLRHLAGKPQMIGSGPNFQHHCHRAIFCGIGFKFADWVQAVHRIVRYLQKHKVTIDLVYTDLERGVLAKLMQKYESFKVQVAKMSAIIKEYGLAELSLAQALARSEEVERFEIRGQNYTLITNDSVVECIERMPENSVDLILTSVPFGNMYEYSPHLADFGHTDNPAHFWEQMDFIIPELLRVLRPGRIAAIHVKDRIVPGGLTGRGYQTVYPFHVDTLIHFAKYGWGYMGMKTIVTDVVRENNQTYRLGWSEQCKDGTKMGVGMPEYLLIFRKDPTDNKRSYADAPVVKLKRKYSRSRWQIDAHGFTRSNGNRLLTPEELVNLPHAAIFKLFRDFSLNTVYDFEHHVHLGEALEHYSFDNGACNCVPGVFVETPDGGFVVPPHPGDPSLNPDEIADRRAKCRHGRLPVTFMLLQPASWHPDVWTDITRMMTLNAAQSAKGREMHLCPMQFDLADRAIMQWTNEGETVLDPFGGLMTTCVRAIRLKRKAIGIELNRSYLLDGAMYCKAAEAEMSMPSLFDLPEDADIPAEPEDVAAVAEWTGI